MQNHNRSELNKALDQCPAIVQEAVWGEGGYRDQIENQKRQIEKLTWALMYAHNKLYILNHTPDAVIPICKRDSEKAFQRVSDTLRELGHG